MMHQRLRIGQPNEETDAEFDARVESYVAPTTIRIGNDDYPVVRMFSEQRAAIRFEGAVVMVDMVPGDRRRRRDTWVLSQTFESPEESAALAAAVGPLDETQVTVTEGEELVLPPEPVVVAGGEVAHVTHEEAAQAFQLASQDEHAPPISEPLSETLPELP